MKITEEKRYEKLSPFELKNKLLSMAQSNAERMMLNAGRGNPNWLTIEPREAFFQLGLFAMEESKRHLLRPGFGSPAEKKGLEKRFDEFLKQSADSPGVPFLKKAVTYAHKELGIAPAHFLSQIVDAILGDHYPTPDRILDFNEKAVHSYINQEILGGEESGKFDLFATEGGTAAMAYIFNSLMENKILHKGDTIALGTPIFTPYIEIPHLNDYKFVTIKVEQDENEEWQYPDKEIEKLADPAIKAFFLVHPSNPTSVSINPKSFEKIADLVKNKHRDLIILTDDVYGTFVNGFKSLAVAAPHNTILVYSYSKYFGATGWRLGVIAIHENNIFDKKISELPDKDKQELNKRYSTIALYPEKLKFIERMVADSRAVALRHTSGASTPQQVLMTLFSIFCLIDKEGEYKKLVQDIVRKRFETLYNAIGIDCPKDPYGTHYYTIIDIPKLAKNRYGQEFANYLVNTFEPIDFVMRLAEERAIVLLDGGGFDAPNMSVRISLANLPDDAYEEIGKSISWLLEQYYNHWKSKR
ncbi:bifunctional aspartate transaminase/aspartate 4-decarboxylase [Candidatus Dependentiae bacterium]|nr:MAG: bifunctional aspartate transaminase/aspartate 4-decarboxylase [Candidatus Dependentiae bacterium]